MKEVKHILKKCNICGENLPATIEFFYECGKYLSSRCKKCANEYSKEYNKRYYRKNSDKIKERAKNRVRNLEQIEHRKQYMGQYYNTQEKVQRKKELAKKYYYKHSKELTERKRKWRNTEAYKNNEKIILNIKIYKARRRSRKKGAISNYSSADWIKCREHFDERCAYCGKEEKLLEQDHFIPLSKSGEYTISNIVPSCKSCNSSKQDKDFFEWYAEQIFYSKGREQKILKYLSYNKDRTQQLKMII